MYRFGPDQYDAEHMARSLTFFLEMIQKKPSPNTLAVFIRENYRVYRARGRVAKGRDNVKEVLFTGYYEPSLAGSLTQDDEYRYPLYPVPSDLLKVDISRFSNKYKGESALIARLNNKNRVVPYYTRAEINAMPDFADRAEPIAWVRDLTDRFFLEIQGSGRILLKDGGYTRVHYNGKNGRAYHAIGRYLIDIGEIPKKEMSMQAIRSWLEKNPHRRAEVFHTNPSFVFFQLEEGGPFGSLGVVVTPRRSIATDRKLFPKGGLCFLETYTPVAQGNFETKPWEEHSAFVLNQDTGGAIRGAARADIFYGNGRYAEYAAGHMQHNGQLYFLVLKPDTP